MSKVPELKKLRIEDFKAPDQNFKTLIEVLGRYMESVYTIVKSGITVEDNILGEFKDISLTSIDIPISITLSSKIQKVKCVIPVSFVQVADNYTALTFAPQLSWRQVDRTIVIYGISGIASNTKYDVRVLIL